MNKKIIIEKLNSLNEIRLPRIFTGRLGIVHLKHDIFMINREPERWFSNRILKADYTFQITRLKDLLKSGGQSKFEVMLPRHSTFMQSDIISKGTCYVENHITIKQGAKTRIKEFTIKPFKKSDSFDMIMTTTGVSGDVSGIIRRV